MADQTKDELEIRQLVSRFSDACVVDDAEAFRSLWAPNGVWEISAPFTMQAEGVDAVVALYGQLRSPWETFLQMTHSGTVRVEGDKARARFVMQEVGRNATAGKQYNNFGLYLDSLVRLEGGWRFARRTFQFLWLDMATPIPGQSFPVPENIKRFV